MSSEWNSKFEWCFSPLGTGDKVGVNNAGIGIFKKQPYIGLAKEILQNVIDAKDPDVSGPAKACFEVIRVHKNEILGADRLSEVIKSCAEYYHEGDDGKKMRRLKEAAEELLDNDTDIPVLKISDYNTVGLTGAHKEKGSNWTGLVREISATNKGNGLSGSFGVGKFAPFNFSRLRTIVYSTYNKDGETALQGKTILTTFRDTDGKLKQNVGLFGLLEDEDCKAIYDIKDIPALFQRKEYGTDLYVLGFQEEKEWMQQIAVSVLEYFFYTIFNGELEVNISDGKDSISINKDNLNQNMLLYQEYCEKRDIEFSAPMSLEILNDKSGQTKHFREPFRNKGEVELYLKLDPDFTERTVVEMRKAGMKIQEDSSFRLGANFRGVFIATGKGSKSDDPKDNINSFLRKCENQAHDTWSKDEYEDNKEEAGRIIKAIHQWILEKVKSEMPAVDTDETAAYGLSDLLPNQDDEGAQNQEEAAFASFAPKPVEITPTTSKTIKKRASDVNVVNPKNETTPSDIVIPGDDEQDDTTPGGGKEPTPKPPVPGPYPGPYPGPFPGPDPVPNPKPQPDGPEDIPGKKQEETKTVKGQTKLHGIHITDIRTPYDSSSGTFRVSFTPETTADEVYVRLKIGSDDEDKPNADIQYAKLNGQEQQTQKEFIILEHIEKGRKIILSVRLNNARRCPLEVTAYVK